MDAQTAVVILIVLGAAAYLVNKYVRAAKNPSGGCGCSSGCGGCGENKKSCCGGNQ
ncbi:FeoB-associated Cys-rich membrane protein [Deltaproteobacteria bacterium OttesenSCG-928-K17]|nr:FeoB-associated Cys-rich membrane protein [Deltaproteobacteria bacterium OttesenSCG-928-K17]